MKLVDLKEGDLLRGTVTRTAVSGAFLDVGAETEGFVHISRLSPTKVNRVEDVLAVGQEVESWVRSVDAKSQRLELTLIRPLKLKWDEIRPGLRVTGEVRRLESFGAFVDIGAEREGLVHVSEMSDEYVRDPSELVKVGEEVEVSVLEVDRAKRQVRLTMKVTFDEAVEEDEEDEPTPTAMELALRAAMGGGSGGVAEDDESAGQPLDKRRGEQDDLLQRTLSDRLKTSSDDERGESK